MTTKLQLFLFSFFGMFCWAQSLRPVAKDVQDYHSKRVSFQEVRLFDIDRSGKQVAYQQAARDLRVLNLDRTKLKNIVSEKPEAMELTFPFEDRELVVEMVRVDIYAPGFNIETNKRKINDYQKGVFYRGIIKGNNTSVVAFSFFDNDVVGIASANNIGNVTLGKAKNSEDFVVYNDQKMTGSNPFICGVDEMMDNEKGKISFNPKTSRAPQMTNNCVRLYYEICNKPFKENGSSVTTTVNWISAIHNNVNTLYMNDGVKMSLKKIFVWETADPYTGTYNDNLYDFSKNRTFFDGDLAHLVNYPTTTSVAYLNSLCTESHYAYSGVSMTYSNVPTYTWTVSVMTHEMGHSLGSPHTHACAWNGDNTAIDGCGPASGYSEGCTGPIPAKGTIMSYCHLSPNTGISLALGFGEQPAALIRETIDSKTCLVSDCSNACTSASTVFSIGDTSKNTVSVNVETALASGVSAWDYRVLSPSGNVISTGIATDNPFTINGLLPGTFYRIEAGTSCSGTYQMSQIILTNDNWCGKTLTDSGGPNANYTDGENWVKTFYPDSEGQKMKITFQHFDLQQSKDFLTVRNGPGADAPVFPGGNNMTGTFIRGPFESTHPSGAITLVFKSDATINKTGFKALLSCSVLAVDDIASSAGMSLLPNPVKDKFTLNTSGKIIAVRLFDSSGKMIKDFDGESISKNTFDISRIKTGSYVVSIKTDTQTISKKIIKE